MPVKIECSKCGAVYSVADDRVGKKMLCKECDASIIARAVKSRAAKADDDEDDERPARKKRVEVQDRKPAPKSSPRRRDDDEDEDEKPRPRRKIKSAQSGSALPWILIGGGVLLVLLACGVGSGAFFWVRARKAEVAVVPNNLQLHPAPGILDPNPNQNLKPDPDPVPAGNGQLPPEVLRKVKTATAYLRVRLSDGTAVTGSGFLASFGNEQGIVLTNAHVLGMLDPESRPPKSVDVVFNSGEPNELHLPGQILGVDASSDLAMVRVNGAGLPTPLQVKSAAGLVETQRVYVFGFPLGERLGKEITIRESSVSSLRKDAFGNLDKVQVNGGMDPGNSGGPVVDSRGDVVGVAVAVIRNTQINFAIPGDYVSIIANGRIRDGRMDSQAYVQPDGKIGQPVRLSVIDPLNRIKQVAVDVWVGDAKAKNRPPSLAQPTPEPGDSPHQHIALTYVNGVAQGEVPMPPLAPGKVLFVQPYWVNGAGEPHWSGAMQHFIDLTINPAVERKSAELILRHAAVKRPVALKTTNTFRLRMPDEELSKSIGMNADLMEDVRPDAQGAIVGLNYTKFSLRLTNNDTALPSTPTLQRLVNNVPLAVGVLRVDRAGNIAVNKADLSRVPAQAKEDVGEMHEQIQHGIEAMAIPLPNRMVRAGETWKATRTLPIDTPGQPESGVMDMTYELRGTRMRNGREEAVIGLSGVLRGPAQQEERMGGNADGLALVDLATGQVSMAWTSVRIDMRSKRSAEVRLTGTLEVKLDRRVP